MVGSSCGFVGDRILFRHEAGGDNGRRTLGDATSRCHRRYTPLMAWLKLSRALAFFFPQAPFLARSQPSTRACRFGSAWRWGLASACLRPGVRRQSTLAILELHLRTRRTRV